MADREAPPAGVPPHWEPCPGGQRAAASPEPSARPDPSPYGADLGAAEADIWQRLLRATRDRRSPWHTPALATTGADGAPRARVLVLRGVARESRLLRLHTDVRSGKVAELAADPRCALLFYDPGARLQLRASGCARVERDSAAADAAWAGTRLLGRRCYLAPVAPGTPAAGPVSGLPPALEGRQPTAEESESGRAHFAIVLVTVHRLEFLQLAFSGHRRGAFDWRDDVGAWTGHWLVP